MQHIKVPMPLMEKLMNYLGRQPFVQVAPLIQEIQVCEVIEEKDNVVDIAGNEVDGDATG